ncbi:TRAP transporter substrate-binding protein [Salibacterium lacus]|uniref:TRAP transporter substrate-binding protein n=1 Tax=Salibacterium lacus TaxID=1898109 RepID=A0ABW5T5T5_9BACI
MKWLAGIKIILLVIVLSACQTAQGEKDTSTLILAHSHPTSHPIHKAMEVLKEEVEEKTNNELHLKIYPNGNLGSEREVIERTQIGTVDIAKVSVSSLESFEPSYAIFSLPYLFENKEQFHRVMTSSAITEELYNKTIDSGFRGLSYYSGGVRNVYTADRQVQSPEDMQGLKIRVQASQTSVQMINAMGGVPTPMSYSQVYTALQSGVIGGAENNATALTSSNHGEVAKNYFYTEHSIVPDMLIISDKTYNQLSDEHRRILQEAASTSTNHHRELWQKAVNDAKETAKQEMNVNFQEVDKQAFIEAVQPMHEQFKNDPATSDIYQTINEVK